jgi:predicted restriction endonuclease
MKRSKQSKAKNFAPGIIEDINLRDRGTCLFCRRGYHMESTSEYGRSILDCMHYIPRSQGGMGIAQNGAIGCRSHHMMMDNGNKGRREEMLGIMREYLMQQYPQWDEKELVYNKWKAFG